MNAGSGKFSRTVPAVLMAFGVSLFFHLMQSDAHLNWADEGFLWYGVQQTALGHVPVRDFQSYEPARYYWCVFWQKFFGQGLLGLRHAAWLFQALALSCGALALQRALKSRAALLMALIVSVLWQFWAFRYFDSGYPILAIFFAVRFLERPTFRRYFAAGVFAGFSSLWGLNHALYVLAAFYALAVFGDVKGAVEQPSKKRLVLAAGVTAGLLPLAGMLLFIPGLCEEYLKHFWGLAHLLSSGSTDIRTRIQWPWTLHWDDLAKAMPDRFTCTVQYWNLWAKGATVIKLILFYGLTFWAVLRLKKEELSRNALLAAAYFVGFFYLNQVFARSDITHLGEGVFRCLPACWR